MRVSYIAGDGRGLYHVTRPFAPRTHFFGGLAETWDKRLKLQTVHMRVGPCQRRQIADFGQPRHVQRAGGVIGSETPRATVGETQSLHMARRW